MLKIKNQKKVRKKGEKRKKRGETVAADWASRPKTRAAGVR